MPSLERYRTQGETSVGWRSMPSSSVRRPNRVLRLAYFVVLACGGISRLFAAPVITSVANAASNIALNAPLAQGAVFVLKGTGLGPANISLAPAAFQSTSLSGTSVAVTVGDTTVNALMYYTSDSQVAALLPSSTPTGSGSFTVTYDGQISNSMGHTIVASNLGILTIDSTGQGPAVVTFSDYGLVSAAKAANCGGPNTACGAANPGDTLTLWGTGFLKAKVVSATVGGLDVGVLYWGPQSASAGVMGLDQINIGPLPRTLIGHGRVNIIVTADGQTANPVQVVVK